MSSSSDERLRYPWYYDLPRNHFFEDGTDEEPVIFEVPQQFQKLGEIMAEKLNERICQSVRKRLLEKSSITTIRGCDTTLWCQLRELAARGDENLLIPHIEAEITPFLEPLCAEEKALLWILENDFYKKGPENDDMECRIRQMILHEILHMAHSEAREEANKSMRDR